MQQFIKGKYSILSAKSKHKNPQSEYPCRSLVKGHINRYIFQ